MPNAIRGIGASKFATVSECQTPQGGPAAVKEFNRLPLSRLQHERIFAAAEQWKRLSLPALVPYLEVSPRDNYILMEMFDRSAAIRLREGNSDSRLVLHAIRGILAALAQLHDLGLLHVNLKPTNVFFDFDGRARLSDGLLLNLRSPVSLPPPTNQKYLTPEQTSDAFGPLTPATDLYAVGFIALELLAGDRFKRSFQGIGDNISEDDPAWFQWHSSSQIAPSATSFARNCQTELSAVIARMVAKQPELRYASARQVLQDLPQDIAGQTNAVTGKPQAVMDEGNREALSTDIVARPATGIVLAIASGPRAGEMIGTNENEFLLGFDHDCFIRFSSEHYAYSRSKVLIRRSSQGWYALRVAGEGAFINQNLLEEKRPLRTGDIVRLSSRGPDVQFTMQSGGVAVRSLVSRFLPSQAKQPAWPVIENSAVKPAPPQRVPVKTELASAIGPQPLVSAVPTTPVLAAPTGPAVATRVPAAPAGARSTSLWRQKNILIGLVGGIILIIAAVLLMNFLTPAETQDLSPDTDLENSQGT